MVTHRAKQIVRPSPNNAHIAKARPYSRICLKNDIYQEITRRLKGTRATRNNIDSVTSARTRATKRIGSHRWEKRDNCKKRGGLT